MMKQDTSTTIIMRVNTFWVSITCKHGISHSTLTTLRGASAFLTGSVEGWRSLSKVTPCKWRPWDLSHKSDSELSLSHFPWQAESPCEVVERNKWVSMAKVPDPQEMLGGSAVWLNLGWKGKHWNLLLTFVYLWGLGREDTASSRKPPAGRSLLKKMDGGLLALKFSSK